MDNVEKKLLITFLAIFILAGAAIIIQCVARLGWFSIKIGDVNAWAFFVVQTALCLLIKR